MGYFDKEKKEQDVKKEENGVFKDTINSFSEAANQIIETSKKIIEVPKKEIIIPNSVKTPIVNNTRYEEVDKSKTSVVKPVKTEIDNAKSSQYYGDIDVVNIKNLNQIYKDKDGSENVVFENLNFNIKDVKKGGQFVVIVGASGCGKSTILRYIAGLQKPTNGEIFIDGQLQTEKDRAGMVFQQYSSFPWRSVLDNVAFSLELQGINREEREEKAMEMIKLVGLEGHENKWAQHTILSGGQLQRVALARNLVSGDKIILFDEVTSGLDVSTKLEMDDLLCDVFVELNKKLDATFILSTHDLTEAVYLADEIYVMDANPGRVVKKINIDLPFERDRSIKRTSKFIKYVHDLEDIMLEINKK